MTVRLFALSTCPYCRMTRAYLDENDVDYELTEVDHLDGDERQAAIAEVKELSGGTSFPVLVIDGEVIVGFNKAAIRDRLGLGSGSESSGTPRGPASASSWESRT